MLNFLKDLGRARLFRHPIHAMLVHFPSAFLPVAFLFDLIAFFTRNPQFALIAFFMLVVGVLGGVMAAFFGAIDYYHLPQNHPGWKKASLHAFLNVVWLSVFGTLLGLKMNHYPFIPVSNPVQLIISGTAVLGLIFSNYLGGELVFHFKVGTYKEKR